MQKVSKEYKASMKDSLRERAYIMISFGCSFSRKMQNIFASFAKTYFKNRKRTF